MNHIITVCSIALSILFLTSSPRIDAAIYKWTDDNGQINYSAIAPDTNIKKDNIEEEIARISQITASPTGPINTDSSEEDTNNKNSSDKNNTGYCKQQQSIIKSLESNPYVKWKVGDKETLLEGEEKAAQVEKIKQDVTKFCSPKPAPK